MRKNCLNCELNLPAGAEFCDDTCSGEFNLLSEREQELHKTPAYILHWIARLSCSAGEQAELHRRYMANTTRKRDNRQNSILTL